MHRTDVLWHAYHICQSNGGAAGVRNLWVEKQEPLAALRAAQLHLYRHPEQIATLAKLRGIDFTEKDLPKVTVPPPGKGDRAPTSQWAAFILSGLGR